MTPVPSARNVPGGWRGPFAWAYDANKVLDVNEDGAITVQDLTDKIARAQSGARWNEFASRVHAAMQQADTLPEVNEMNRDAVTVPDVTSEVFPGGDDEGPAAA